MAFRLPNFNLPVNIWRATNFNVGPPDVVTVGNLSPGRFVSQSGDNPDLLPVGNVVGYMVLRLPALTDIRDGQRGGIVDRDFAEVPAGSQRYYVVWQVDDVAKGFANEYRFALLVKAQAGWPFPYP